MYTGTFIVFYIYCIFVTILVRLTLSFRHFQGYTLLAMQAAFHIDNKDRQL